MRRALSRLSMALAGSALLVGYGGAGFLVANLLLSAFDGRPSSFRIVAYVLSTTFFVGYLSYRFGTASLLDDLDAVEIAPGDAPALSARLKRIESVFDVRDVTLYAARMDAPNALAIGAARGGAVVLDVELFRLLTAAELEAIVAHEIAHLERRDGLMQTLGYSFVRTVGGLCYLFLLPIGLFVGGTLRALSWFRGKRPQPFLEHLAIVQWRIAQFVVLALFVLTLALRAHSRRREYAADDRAIEATGDPIALARALVKIQRASLPGWGFLSPLYVHGDEEGLLTRLLATHPPMDERIERLVRRAREMRRPDGDRRAQRR